MNDFIFMKEVKAMFMNVLEKITIGWYLPKDVMMGGLIIGGIILLVCIGLFIYKLRTV